MSQINFHWISSVLSSIEMVFANWLTTNWPYSWCRAFPEHHIVIFIVKKLSYFTKSEAHYHVGFEFLTLVTMKGTIILDVTPRCPVEVNTFLLALIVLRQKMYCSLSRSQNTAIGPYLTFPVSFNIIIPCKTKSPAWSIILCSPKLCTHWY
jgi:hypothetical protein